MDDYYDKEKFTGGQTPPRQTPPPYPPPPPRRQPPKNSSNNSGWYSWPVIIILFSLGIWPVALALMFFNLFGDSSKRKNQNAASARKTAYRQTESAVERAMRNAEARADRAAGRAVDRTDEAIRRAAAQVERTISRTARQVEQSAKAVPPFEPAKTEQPKKAKQAKIKKSKPAGVLLRMLGIIFLAVGGLVGMDFLSEIASGYSPDFDNFFASISFLFSGGLMFFRGHYLNRMNRRSQRYILAIGNVDAMPLDVIAKRVNRPPAKAAKELQKLIDKGYLGEDAYIDHERGYFLRFGATLEEERPPEPEAVPVEPTPRETEEGYSGILRKIRHANDRIADPELSRKIDRLEQVSGLIFREVEEHPEKRERIRTFFDYYLPTTQKLLDTYAEFEETGVEGENLRQAKERIEQTMDAIVEGFEHQLDQLYSADAMDVVSDIKVMEAMLNRDMATMARDFGIDASRPVEGKRVKRDEDGPRLQL